MKRQRPNTPTEVCPFLPVVELIGGRWKSEISWHLHSGTRRFNELRRLLNGITPKTLTQQLREMQRDGLIRRTQYNEIPPRVDYDLTPLGKSLDPVFSVIANWGTRHLAEVQRARKKYDRSARTLQAATKPAGQRA